MCLYGEGVVLAVLVLERMGGGGGERVLGWGKGMGKGYGEGGQGREGREGGMGGMGLEGLGVGCLELVLMWWDGGSYRGFFGLSS